MAFNTLTCHLDKPETFDLNLNDNGQYHRRSWHDAAVGVPHGTPAHRGRPQDTLREPHIYPRHVSTHVIAKSYNWLNLPLTELLYIFGINRGFNLQVDKPPGPRHVDPVPVAGVQQVPLQDHRPLHNLHHPIYPHSKSMQHFFWKPYRVP